MPKTIYILTCPHKGRGRGIQSCDLHFIMYGSQPIELPFGDFNIGDVFNG
jgi:hypothetical protein